MRKKGNEMRPDYLEQDYLTYEEVRIYLGLDSISTIEKWVQAEKIPFTRISAKCVRFPRKLLAEWLAAKTFMPVAKPLSLVRGRHAS